MSTVLVIGAMDEPTIERQSITNNNNYYCVFMDSEPRRQKVDIFFCDKILRFVRKLDSIDSNIPEFSSNPKATKIISTYDRQTFDCFFEVSGKM